MQELQDQQAKELADLKAHYDSVTTSDLDALQQLRAEVVDLTRKEAAASRSVLQLTAQNKSLHEPLAQVRDLAA